MELGWDSLAKQAASRVSGSLEESVKPVKVILFQNIVGFSQFDKMKGWGNALLQKH